MQDAATNPTTQPKRKRAPKVYKLTTSGIPILDNGDLKTKVYVNQLVLTKERIAEYEAFYSANPRSNLVFDRVFDHENDPDAQNQALAFLRTLGITSADGACPSKRYTRAWSKNKDNTPIASEKTAPTSFRRTLLQWCVSISFSTVDRC